MIIGIDPGVITGFAVWDDATRAFKEVASLKIHEAMQKIIELKPDIVVFEDARQRNWFGGRDVKQHKYGAGVREGSGSVKRDCAIWEDFLKDLGVKYIAMAPAAKGTKWKADKFKATTGWSGRTSQHARDAAVLVFGMSVLQFEVLQRKSELRVATLRKVRATRRRRRKASADLRAHLTCVHPTA
jgi:hypothetical protein